MPLILLIAWIFVEAWIIARLAERFGSLAVLAWLALAAVAGTLLIREQGLRTVRELRSATQSGELPAQSLLEALVAVIGGLLLILPGLISDAVGLTLLLLGGTRRSLARRVQEGMARSRPELKRPVTLEGDYRRKR